MKEKIRSQKVLVNTQYGEWNHFASTNIMKINNEKSNITIVMQKKTKWWKGR
jgi:hypothetical protein